MCHYTHFTIKERECLLLMKKDNIPNEKIAKILGRSFSSVSRELKRNSINGEYSCVVAEEKYRERRQNCKRKRILDDPAVKEKVLELFLERQWSPEQISNRLKLEKSPIQISYSTIYRAIYDHSLEPVPLTRGKRGLARKLRHRGKTRHAGGYVEKRGKYPVSNRLCDRPKEAENRSVIGHFEADTVLGKLGSECLLTVVDRASRFLFAKKCISKKSDFINDAMIDLFKNLPREKFRSITPDRGNEFKKHAEVTQKLGGVPFYFPPPGSPWHRGTNENTNGLIREYLPKKFDMALLSDEDIADIVFKINSRPRKCLGWLSPFESFYNLLLHLT